MAGDDRKCGIPGIRGPLTAGMVAVAAVMARLPGLGGTSLWGDEAYSLAFVSQDVRRIMTVALLGGADVHPPFYYLLLHGWTLLFGSGTVAARSLSLLAGCAAAVGLYLLGRRLFGPRAALAAGLFAAVSPYFVQAGTEIRMYSLLAAAAVYAHLAFSMICGLGEPAADTRIPSTARGEGGSGAGPGGAIDCSGTPGPLWLIASLAAVYTHHLGWLLPAVHWSHLLLSRFVEGRFPRGIARFARLQALMLLLAAPAVASLIIQAGARLPHFESPLSLLKRLAGIHVHFSMGYIFANFNVQAVKSMLGEPRLLLLLLAGSLPTLYFLIRAARSVDIRDRTVVRFVIVSLIVPLLLGIVFFPMNLGARYMVAAAVGFFLLLSRGMTRTPGSTVSRAVLLPMILANVISLATAFLLPTDVVHREDWGALDTHLAEQARPGDFVGCENILAPQKALTRGVVLGSAKMLRYDGREFQHLGGRTAWIQVGVDGSSSREFLSSREEKIGRFWKIEKRTPFGRDLILYHLVRKPEMAIARIRGKSQAYDMSGAKRGFAAGQRGS